jgi:hypothetical protein
LCATRKPFFGHMRAMLLKKCDASTSAMPVTGQTMADAALPANDSLCFSLVMET